MPGQELSGLWVSLVAMLVQFPLACRPAEIMRCNYTKQSRITFWRAGYLPILVKSAILLGSCGLSGASAEDNGAVVVPLARLAGAL